LKLHPLLLGRTKVPFGQFYGGLAGWEGFGALFRFITDKAHFIWVPIHAYLLEHPKQGLVLIDAGICPEQVHQHGQYYRGILRLILDEDEYAQEPAEALPEQLKRLGFRPDDVRTVILTHLHEDHVGALRELRKAKVVISKTEWDVRHMKMFGFIPMFYEPSYSSVEQWERVAFDSGAFHSFGRSQDLFRDGSIRLLPTPGHTPGHLSVLLEMGTYQLLVTGDCLYTLRHLATRQVQAVRMSKKMGNDQIESINKIGELKRLVPGIYLVPGHDHTEYQWQHLVPYLSKGWLTEDEQRSLANYESKLFDSSWALRPEDLPKFVLGGNVRGVGAVSEPSVQQPQGTKTAVAAKS
jgi:glyoxylase-like metal-dependent hydrolase (beta-lactamase superfamily II)